jgi:D-amino peptidase
MNLSINDLPEYVTLHRGWEGSICSMMAGLDESFDAVIFIGYHSPSRSNGNPLSHTLNTRIHHIKLNGVIASEFDINAYYATYLNIPVAFLSGDKHLTEHVQMKNNNIEVVATKEGHYGAVVSVHPSITNRLIEETVEKALNKNLKKNIVSLPATFDLEVQYRRNQDAYNASFFPGCKLLGTDRVIFKSDNYYDILTVLKFIV